MRGVYFCCCIADDMNELFSRLGCAESQEKIYLQLLELGPSIASMLSKRLGIKRVTVYGALEGLQQKGLVETFHKNNVTYYQASDPEIVGNLLDLQLEEEQKFNARAHKKLEELKSIKRKSEKHIIELKGVIRYYEGADAVQTLIKENLKLPDKLQYCIGMSGYHALQFAGEWNSYIQARVNNGMKVLSLQANNGEGRAYQKRDGKELRETCLISSEKIPVQGELNIIGDHIILFTSEEKEALGVKITHKKIAGIVRKLFELAWGKAKKIAAEKKSHKF